MGNSLIECLQQTYERQRFDLFSSEAGDTANPDITQAVHKKRAVIRDRTFTWVAVGMGLIVLFHPLFWIGAASLATLVVSNFSSALWLEPAAKTVFWSMFALCFIDLVGVAIVERRVKAGLKELAFHVPSKFLI